MREDSKLSPDVSVWDLPWFKKVWLQIALLVVVFISLYSPVFFFLVRTWWENNVYSHGFLVPPIAIYLVWVKREQLRQLELAPSFLGGVPLMIVAGLVLVLGKIGALILLQEISLPVMIGGIVLLLMGQAYLNALALPIAYLVFMIPLFGEGNAALHWPFQLIAAQIGVWLLHVVGLVAFQEAQYIYLPNITLEVAEACSGIRYLISVVAIGVPLAYFSQRTWVRRVGLVVLAVVIAILANGLRVALIGVWTYYGGSVLHGPFQIFQAMFVAWIGFVALFVGAWCLGKGPKATKDRTLSQEVMTGPAE